MMDEISKVNCGTIDKFAKKLAQADRDVLIRVILLLTTEESQLKSRKNMNSAISLMDSYEGHTKETV